MGSLFYKPHDAYAADFIPYYCNGAFQLFYLKDWRNKEAFGEGTPWFLISTEDLTNFREHGEVIPRGSVEEQDLYIFTGCIIEAAGLYHIFYTGHNPHFVEQGKPQQAVMHATSTDLLTWTKIPEHTFYAPADQYEQDDWRDPYVFWNDEAGEYWMLLAARLKEGPSRRRGCTALCVSKDLSKWEVRDPFWTPNQYYTHECPDLFKIGDWWYFVFSTFSDRFVTHYRMSKSLKGPWISPPNDTFDNRAFYAAKTATDGSRRYAFGWNPTRAEEKDEGYWQWGGNLVIHELVQEEDGTLSVRVPEAVDRAFLQEVPLRISHSRLNLEATDSFACAIAGQMPVRCKIRAKVAFETDTRGCGIMLRTSEDLEQAYYIRMEPHRNRLVFDRWPRAGDVPFSVELERPVEFVPGRFNELCIFIDDTVCEVYLNDKIAMSARLYDLKTGNWGVFVHEGAASFDDLRMFTCDDK